MSWIDDTLRDFGQQMGLPQLEFGRHKVAQLAFDSGAVLAVEPSQRGEVEEVLVYLSQPLGFGAERAIRQALIKAHHSNLGQMPVQVATRGNGPDTALLALVRIPARNFTLQSLDESFDYLKRWHASLEG